MSYSVECVESNDYLKIQYFIERHWRKGQILGLSKELLNF